MHWHVYEVSLEIIRALRGIVERLARKDPALVKQIRDAANSIPLNLREGRRRVGKDRLHLWRIAAGSADEIRGALDAAAAWGDIDAEAANVVFPLLDRELAMLWKMTRA
jgi:four helix bundle protein